MTVPVPLTGVVDADDLNTDFDNVVFRMEQNATAGDKDRRVVAYFPSIATGPLPDVSMRSLAWTQVDDAELISVDAHVSGATTLSWSLTVDNGDTSFLLDYTFAKTNTFVAAGVSRLLTSDVATAPGVLSLLDGVRYRMTVTANSGGAGVGPIVLEAYLQSKRRRR